MFSYSKVIILLKILSYCAWVHSFYSGLRLRDFLQCMRYCIQGLSQRLLVAICLQKKILGTPIKKWPSKFKTGPSRHVLPGLVWLGWISQCSVSNANPNDAFCIRINCSWIITIDILYTLDSATNYSTIQKLKPWLQTQDIPMKWEDSFCFLFLKQGT
jgi:predicted O-linked N-acetylglucosamine transferase (SPINDLY family)